MPKRGKTNFSEEESLGKVYDHRLMVRLIKYLLPYKITVFTAFILLLLSSILMLAPPILTKYAIDEYIIPGNAEGLLNIALLYVFINILGFLFQYFHYYMMHMTGQRVMYDLRKQIFAHLQRMSVTFFNRNPIGRLMTRLTGDVDALNEMFTSGVVTVFGDLLLLSGIIAVLFYYNVTLALTAISVVPLLFFAALLFKVKARGGFRKVRIYIARINSFMQENLTGMKIVQLFNRERKNFDQFDDINRKHRDAWVRTVLYYALFFPSVEILSAVSLALILYVGGLKITSGTLTWGALVMFIQFAQRFYRPIQDLSEKYNVFQSAMASSERIFKLLDKEEEDQDPTDAAELAEIRGEIEFRNVWFAYKDEEWVLKDVSFRIKPGEKAAIVGATGAGKTTVISLLSRFYDIQKGQILIDGVDIRKIKKDSLRKHIGVVLQDVFLFSGTVEENITLNNPDIPEELLISSSKDVNAHHFISKLENGYREEVRERGNNFSTGQKQLISFARALVYDPKILVLDEATSNIDTETEILIQTALSRLMYGRTSIIIAHRLSTIKNVDRIIVMHKGRIRETGTHRELLEAEGVYYRLYQLQYKEQETIFNGSVNP
ncbi:MAG: ABC transporter ATP-binding protein [bacterium]|nr:ABC transporter ATP-binding protein [bacterium]